MRRPVVLIGLLLLMLGATWIMQGLRIIDGDFFGSRLVSLAAGGVTGASGAALMVGATLRGRRRRT